MKKRLSIILLTLLLLLTGCSIQGEPLEIKRRLIVQAIGIDRADDGGTVLSVQALNTDVSSNASGNSVPDRVVKCYLAQGRTLADCIEQLKIITGKNPLLSQNRVVIFSRELAQNGIAPLLDSFIRNNENRFNVCAAVSQGSAKSIIEAGNDSSVIGARHIEQLIKNSGPEIPETKIYEITNCILDGGKSAVLPVLSVSGGEITVPSVAVFKGDRLASVHEIQLMKGIAFIGNKVQSGSLTFRTDAEAVSLQILKSKTNTETRLESGIPHFTIDVKTSLVLTEYAGNVSEKLDTAMIKEIGNQAEKEIKNYIQTALTQCIIEDGADAFGFSRRLWRRYPDFFRENGNRIIDVLKSSSYTVNVSVEITRTGDSVIKL